MNSLITQMPALLLAAGSYSAGRAVGKILVLLIMLAVIALIIWVIFKLITKGRKNKGE